MHLPFSQNSIARHLALMYAAAAFVIFSIVVSALYFMEMSELERYQIVETQSRFSLFEQIIKIRSSSESWPEIKTRLQELVNQSGGKIFLRIDSKDPFFQMDAPFTVSKRKITKHHGFSYKNINGHHFRILSKKIPATDHRPELIISLAIDTQFYEAEDFWFDFAFVVFLLLGIIAMSSLGWLIAKRGLARVDELSYHASQINPDNLSARLPTQNLPLELEGLIKSFNGALQRLEDSYNRQASFNSDVAHELRTPLGNMIGQTEVALSKPRTNEELCDILASNLEELERLRFIINDMLFLSHADQGEINICLQKLSLAEEAQKTADFLNIIFEENNNTLEVIGDAEASIEPSLFKRALTNLLNNAVEHGAPDAPITVEITKKDGYAVVTVINHGTDIAPDSLPRLFDRFYRVSRDRSNSRNNHGLGLAIVKAIAEIHKGGVFATSQSGIICIGFKIPL